MGSWLVTVAQLPLEDPDACMRVLRTLESLGAAVMREGVYVLPDTPTNRQALQALSEYLGKSSGGAQVLQVSAASAAQQRSLERLFDRTARYEELIKTVKSLRVGFGHSDPNAIARVLQKQRREYEAIAALDFAYDGAHFPASASRVAYEEMLAKLNLGGNPALAKIASIVHFLEMGGLAVPEAAGVQTLLQGALRRSTGPEELLREAEKTY